MAPSTAGLALIATGLLASALSLPALMGPAGPPPPGGTSGAGPPAAAAAGALPPSGTRGAALPAAAGVLPPTGARAGGWPAAGALPPSAVPRRLWEWPLHPAPAVVRPFIPGPLPWSAGHRGVDLAARPGQAVLAPADGVVAFSGVVADRPVLVLAHGPGLRTTFEPVSGSMPRGSRVARGRPIGTVAGSAASHCFPSSCLHWGTLRGATYIDPLSLLTEVSGPAVLLPLG